MLTLGTFGILEVPISFRCNLGCNYCSHMSPRMSHAPFVSVDELERMFQDWQPRLAPRYVRIIGGETLLHPQIEEVIEVFAKHWGREVSAWAGIELVTNGSLLDQMKSMPGGQPSFFEQLAKHNIMLRVSLHHTAFRERLDRILADIHSPKAVSDYAHDHAFHKWYDMVDGNPQLFRSQCSTANQLCYVKRTCHELIDNQLYHCSVLAYFRKAHELGVINDERLLAYQPATPDMSDAELWEWWHSDFTAICECCPQEREYVPLSEKWNNFDAVDKLYLSTVNNENHKCSETAYWRD